MMHEIEAAEALDALVRWRELSVVYAPAYMAAYGDPAAILTAYLADRLKASPAGSVSIEAAREAFAKMRAAADIAFPPGVHGKAFMEHRGTVERYLDQVAGIRPAVFSMAVELAVPEVVRIGGRACLNCIAADDQARYEAELELMFRRPEEVLVAIARPSCWLPGGCRAPASAPALHISSGAHFLFCNAAYARVLATRLRAAGSFAGSESYSALADRLESEAGRFENLTGAKDPENGDKD